MGRLFTPFQQFLDKNGNPLSSGTLEFFQNNDLANQQDTYSDPNLNNANPNPLTLDGEGRVSDVFGDGVYTVVLKDKNGVLIDEPLNTVGGDIGSRTAFSDWTSTILYGIPAIVVGSDGKYYQSLSLNNIGNDPVSSPTFWEEIRFVGVYNEFVTYSTGEVAQEANGDLWRSVVDNNINNTPSTDDGSNWLPAVDVDNILSDTNTVVPQTGGGMLTALRNNEIRDGSTYMLPLANSVEANQTIAISQPDEFATNQPTVQKTGSDTISYSAGTDAEILFDNTSSIEIKLTSDGVSDWSL